MSELKSYINRVLGNSLRCLLPSYWWKRLFGLLVDKVEEVDKSVGNKQEKLVSGENIKTINGEDILGNGNIEIEGGSNVTVDAELDKTSVNPIANKAVANALEDKASKTYVTDEIGKIKIPDAVKVDTELSEESSNAIANSAVTAALKNKVEKVDGKQLSTEDFTSLLKAKLEGLSNYDDSSIKNAINSLTTQINTLVSGDASVAIESFNEIIAFLNGIEDSESLDSIIAAIEQQIAGCVTSDLFQQEITNVENQITGVATAIPQRTSQLNNDSGFTTEEYVNTQVRTAIISALNTEV